MEMAWLLESSLIALALLLGGRLCGLSAPSRKRIALSSLGCGGLSLLCTMLRISWLSLVPLPAAVSICYLPQGRANLGRATVMTLLSTFFAGGLGMCLLPFIASQPLTCLSALALLGASLPLIRLTPSLQGPITQLELRMGNRQVLLPAMTDTGNLLRDPITGCAVIIISARAARPLFPDAVSLHDYHKLPPGFRLLPVHTAAGSTLMPLFRPGGCELYLDGRAQPVQALVAIAPDAYRGVQALVPSCLPSVQLRAIGGQP